MLLKKNKPKNIFKTIALILVFVLISFSIPKKAQATVWPGVDPGISEGLQAVYDQIQGVILALLKTQAARQITQQVSSALGGNASSGPMFITNWQSYLITDPTKQANSYINDYISQTTRGRGSLTSYEGFSGGGNYFAQMVQMAKASTSGQTAPQMTYTGDPSQMFDSLNFKNMQLYLSGINNPWSYDANTQMEYQRKIDEYQRIANTMATAYSGFKGVTSRGSNGQTNVTNPGSLVMMAAANAQDVGNKIVASATHIQEVIMAVVSQINIQALQNGVGNTDNGNSKQDTTQNNYNNQVQQANPTQSFIGGSSMPDMSSFGSSDFGSPF
jgi:hypothetical protein